jgi:cytochrome c biogenesis protein CcmG/thiol:disulfide interchange protein DsbE
MSASSRAAVRARRSRGPISARLLIGGVAGVVVIAFALAALLSSSPEKTQPSEGVETADVTLTGDPLAPYSVEAASDPAVGEVMPTIEGQDFTGRKVTISDDGRPKIVLLLAHWCPHCQAEVPVLQEWFDSGATHGDLDVYSIVTSTDATKPNYPPSEWLDVEGWTARVLLDDDASSAASIAGVTSYPFFVFVDADGVVRQRAAGELPIPTIEAAVAAITSKH